MHKVSEISEVVDRLCFVPCPFVFIYLVWLYWPFFMIWIKCPFGKFTLKKSNILKVPKAFKFKCQGLLYKCPC